MYGCVDGRQEGGFLTRFDLDLLTHLVRYVVRTRSTSCYVSESDSRKNTIEIKKESKGRELRALPSQNQKLIDAVFCLDFEPFLMVLLSPCIHSYCTRNPNLF